MNLSYQTQTATRSRFLTFEAALTYTVDPPKSWYVPRIEPEPAQLCLPLPKPPLLCLPAPKEHYMVGKVVPVAGLSQKCRVLKIVDCYGIPYAMLWHNHGCLKW